MGFRDEEYLDRSIGFDGHKGDQKGEKHQPMTQVIDGVRDFLLDQCVSSHGWQARAWCVGILLIFAPLFCLALPAHDGPLTQATS
jgi:hypothetical protein